MHGCQHCSCDAARANACVIGRLRYQRVAAVQWPGSGGRPQAFLGTDVVKAALNLTGSALAAITGSRRSPAVLAMHALAACVKCGTCIVQRCEHAPPSPAMPRCLCVMAVRWRPPLPRAGGSRRARHGVQRAHAARAVLKKICDHPALLSERMAGEVGAAGAAAPPCAPAQQALDSCKHADAGGHMGLPAHAELGSKNSRRARTDAHMGIVTFLWLSRGC